MSEKINQGESNESTESIEGSTRLYIGNLKYDVTKEDLLRDLPQYTDPENGELVLGPISEASVIIDKVTGNPTGFGFLTVKTADAKKFLQASGIKYAGRSLIIRPAKPKETKEIPRG